MGGVGFNVVEQQNTVLATPPLMLEKILPDATYTGHGQDPFKRQRTMSKVDLQSTPHTSTG